MAKESERDKMINALMAIALGDRKPVKAAMKALGWKEGRIRQRRRARR